MAFSKDSNFGGSWANGERQHYTDRPINSSDNGTLKIIALKEDYIYRVKKNIHQQDLILNLIFNMGD